MLKDECTVAIFDVDGTLVNGNCSRIFIDFLSANKVVTSEDTSRYLHLIKKYNPAQEDHVRIAIEAFSILSGIDTELLHKLWEECFEREVIPKMNRYLIEIIRTYQNQDKPVFLASGSPGILVKNIAGYLHIPEDNMIASSINSSNGAPFIYREEQYCIGSGKEAAICRLFKKRKLHISRACFYTDNLTDIPLLKKVGEGYWAGTDSDFVGHKLARFGIKKVFHEKKSIAPPVRSGKLDDYYQRHHELIESAISAIFPITCQQKELDKMMGKAYTKWDLATMQKAFFDPVNEYLSAYDHRLLTIGVCIFLEAGGVDLKKHHLLLGIPEFLNISNEVFVDITDWTSRDTLHQCDRSHLEISIFGNASISLLSLPVHNVIHDRIQLSPEVKLRIYEMYTSIVYKSLLGNGIRLYWQEHGDYADSLNEYFSVSALLNGGLFQFGIDLLEILKITEYGKATLSVFSVYVQNAAALVQLMRDKLSFIHWRKDAYLQRKYRFNQNTNLIGIHAFTASGHARKLSGFEDQEELIDLINETSSLEFLNGLIKEYKEKVANNIDALPFDTEYKRLIENYTFALIHL